MKTSLQRVVPTLAVIGCCLFVGTQSADALDFFSRLGGVSQKGAHQKGAHQKGAHQKGGACQKSAPQKGGACQKGACQKTSVQKGGACQKGAHQKGAHQKGSACQKGGCDACQKGRPRLFGRRFAFGGKGKGGPVTYDSAPGIIEAPDAEAPAPSPVSDASVLYRPVRRLLLEASYRR